MSAPPAALVPTITVQVINLSAAAEHDIVELEESATAIFRHAGVAALWLHCLKVQPGGCTSTRQGDPAHPLIWLRIVNRLDRASVHTLGWTAQGSFTATIQYRRAQQISSASTIGLSAGEILGHVAAHEIGHVLLGPNEHGSSGVMKSSYDKEDLLKMAQGRLLFTGEEARILCARWPTELLSTGKRPHAAAQSEERSNRSNRVGFTVAASTFSNK